MTVLYYGPVANIIIIFYVFLEHKIFRWFREPRIEPNVFQWFREPRRYLNVPENNLGITSWGCRSNIVNLSYIIPRVLQ